jgi:hypothetical protein
MNASLASLSHLLSVTKFSTCSIFRNASPAFHSCVPGPNERSVGCFNKLLRSVAWAYIYTALFFCYWGHASTTLALYIMIPCLGCPKKMRWRGFGLKTSVTMTLLKFAVLVIVGLGGIEEYRTSPKFRHTWQMQLAREAFLVNLVYIVVELYHILEHCVWNNLVFVFSTMTFVYLHVLHGAFAWLHSHKTDMRKQLSYSRVT